MVAEIVIYLMFFLIGIVMGSFFTLATYRIPLKQDITHTRSYCPNCNHRLNFLDLIPVLSYIFLKGKCRYCKQNISPRYILMELFSGVLYLILIILMKINFFHLTIFNVVSIIYYTFIYVAVFITVGILKETRTISIQTLTFGIVAQVLYIIYLYTIKINFYSYIIVLILLSIMFIIGIIQGRKDEIKRK